MCEVRMCDNTPTYTHTLTRLSPPQKTQKGLNSMVLASNTEAILLPVNEPTFGTKRKSQIQTYLEQNGGPGKFDRSDWYMFIRFICPTPFPIDRADTPFLFFSLSLPTSLSLTPTSHKPPPQQHKHRRPAHRAQDGRHLRDHDAAQAARIFGGLRLHAPRFR
jgi:hypothetical protein